MKKAIITVLLILAVVGVLVVPKFLPLGKTVSATPAAPSATAKLPKPSVQAVVLTATILHNSIRATGTLIASDEVELRSEVAGTIIQFAIKEGKRVKKGDMLVKLNDAELQAQLKRAQSRKTLAVAQEARQKQLLEIKSISQNDYDIALNELNSIKAEIELIQAQIRRTEIRAPFNGVIGLRYVSFGAYLTPTTRIASLVNLDTLKIDFAVPGQYAGLIKAGDVVRFSVQGYNETFMARISAAEPKIDAATRTMQVRAVCANGGNLVPGAFAELEMTLNDIPNALVIPTEALVPELKGQRVFVAREGKAKAMDVETGLRTERSLQIVRGLNAGDTVITTGLLQIRDGSPISVTVIDNAVTKTFGSSSTSSTVSPGTIANLAHSAASSASVSVSNATIRGVSKATIGAAKPSLKPLSPSSTPATVPTTPKSATPAPAKKTTGSSVP
jgi:membrane fusion protein (multidrug efflux system)